MSKLTHRLAALFVSAAIVFTVGSASAGLPPGYTELKYIQGNGNGAWIDTELDAGSDVYTFEFGAYSHQMTGGSWSSVLSGTLDTFTLGLNGSTTASYLRFRGSQIASPGLSNTKCNDICITGGVFSVNGVKLSNASGLGTSPVANEPGKLHILNNAGHNRNASGRIFYLVSAH